MIVVTDLAASRGVTGQSEAAVRLLGQVTTAQPRRVTTASRRLNPVMLGTVIESAVPGSVSRWLSSTEGWPGQYL